MSRNLCPALVLALALGAAGSASGDPTGFSSLELGPGARAQAMGSAFASLADDPTASFWNPAGLSRLKGLQVVATHNQWFEGVRQEYVSASKKFTEGTFGLSFGAVYNSDPLLGTDINGDSVGTFGYYELVTTAAFGFRASNTVDVGAGVEYLATKIDELTATGFAMNVGVRVFPGPSNLSLGLSGRHLGPGMTLDTKKTNLPATVQGGMSYMVPAGKGELTLAGDLAKTRGDSRAHALLGAEYTQRNFLSLQAGYRTGMDSEAWSFGVGLTLHSFLVNYALVPMKNELGSSSRIAVTWLAQP